MSTMASHEDASLVLKLYELRREERMRTARAWFAQSFHPKTMDEFNTLCPQGSAENASFRQMVTYWEMAASFLNSGILNKELFYRSGMEMLFTYERLAPLIASARVANSNPLLYAELEKASQEMIEWLNAHAPGAYSAFSKRVRGA